MKVPARSPRFLFLRHAHISKLNGFTHLRREKIFANAIALKAYKYNASSVHFSCRILEKKIAV
jgi:hypothetical protein